MITIRHEHFIHFVPQQSDQDSENNRLLKLIFNQNKEMAKDFSNLENQVNTLTTKVDGLQQTIDAEQEQIKAAIDALAAANAEQTTLIQQLRDELAALGADQAKIDELVTKAEAVNTKLDEIKTDLEGTIADTPVEPPVEGSPV